MRGFEGGDGEKEEMPLTFWKVEEGGIYTGWEFRIFWIKNARNAGRGYGDHLGPPSGTDCANLVELENRDFR